MLQQVVSLPKKVILWLNSQSPLLLLNKCILIITESSSLLFNHVLDSAHSWMGNGLLCIWIINPSFILLNEMISISMKFAGQKKMATMPMHIVYFPSTLGLFPATLSHNCVYCDVLTQVSSIYNAEALVFASLVTIMIEPLFLYQVSQAQFNGSDLEMACYIMLT